MKLRWLLVVPLSVLVMLGAVGCGSRPETVESTAAPIVSTDLPSATPEPGVDPYPGWTTYTHEPTGLSFRYPSAWYGPDVYEFEGGVRLAVGSDVVYPYGTGLEERQPGAPNAYGIVIQYTANTSGWTLEQYRAEQPWFNDALAALDMQDGETSTTARSVTMRERGLAVERFAGVEFVTTLSETAQTERFYMRTAFLMDDIFNVVQITGSPENVEVPDPATWRAAYEAVDAANRGIFEELVASIHVE